MATYLIIMRTVWGSKGDQSPLTNAVLSSASVKVPLSVIVVNSRSLTMPVTRTYYPCLPRQTTAKGLLGHLRPLGAQVLAAVLLVEQWEDVHDNLAAAALDHSLLVEAIQLHNGHRVLNHI